MKKRKYLFLWCLILILCFSLGSCVRIKYFYNYHVVWYSDDPFIEFVGDDPDFSGIIILNGKEYTIYIGTSPGTTRFVGFTFYNYTTLGEMTSNDDLIWEGKAEVKDRKLYLTVEKDYVSDYAGKTIVLNQREIQENNIMFQLRGVYVFMDEIFR